MYYKTHDLGYKSISEAILETSDCIFEAPSQCSFNLQPLETINTLWDEDKFSRINLPKVLYTLSPEEVQHYSYPNDIRVLDCPIKFPHSSYKLPKELMHLKPIVQKIASHEHLTNPEVNDYFCYITLDRRLVKAGNHTRKGGLHVDGFQGARLGEKLPIDHSYLLYDDIPTIFYEQAFQVEPWWDKTCHNYFEGFEKQKQSENARVYPAHTILLIDAYCLHEAPVVEQDTYRTFVRLSYTVREFDRLGNAHNPMFEYAWEMHPRDTQMTLSCPIKGVKFQNT